MDEAKAQKYLVFTLQLLEVSDQEALLTLLRENCLLIDEDWIEVMGLVEQQLKEDGYSEPAQQLQNYRQFFERAITEWNQLTQTAVKLHNQGQYPNAITSAELALTMARIIWLGDHPTIAISLNNLAEPYRSQVRYELAEPLLQQSLDLYKRLLGDDHPLLAGSLNNLAGLYHSQGRYEEAESFYQQSLNLSKRLLGGDHSLVATSLNNLAELYCSQGRHEEAESLYQQSLDLSTRLLGGDHSLVATSSDNLGRLYSLQGRYEEAESLLRQALDLFKRLLGDDHPDVATSLNNLALLYSLQGRYEEAETPYQQSLDLRKRLLGNDHPDVATSLNNLAALYESQGRYKEAEPLYQQSLDQRKRLLGDDHSDVATSLNNLAGLYHSQGRYEEAESLYQQSLDLSKRLLGDDHPHVATSLNNLAVLYQSQSRYELAEPIFWQSLDQRKRLLGDDHPDVASSLNNLAELYRSQGWYKLAELLYRQSLDLYKRLLGDNHPHVASSLNNLAELSHSQGRYEEAELLYQQSLDLRKRLLGDDHPDVASSLNNLAELYRSQSRYEEAGLLFRQSLDQRKRILGDDHPHVADSLNNLALLYRSQGRYEEALTTFRETIAVEQNITQRVFGYSCESDRLRHLDKIRTTTNALLSLVVTHLSDNPTAVQIACDVVLQRKGLSAAAISAFNAVIHGENYQHLREPLQKWRDLYEQIRFWTFEEPTPQTRERLQRLQREADELEKELASKVPEIRLQDQIVNRETVTAQLPAGSVLLEFLRFNRFDLVNERVEPHYLVFILPAGQPDRATLKVLGKATEIDKLIADSRFFAIVYYDSDSDDFKRFDSKKLSPDIDSLLQDSPPKRDYFPHAAIDLRKVIFDPITPYLADKCPLIISPDGELSLLPFQILPVDESVDELLIDRYAISYLSAGRDILRSTVRIDRPAAPPLIIADPKFLLTPEDLENLEINQEPPENPIEPRIPGAIATLDSQDLDRAVATGLMARNVAELLQVQPHLQAAAVTTYLNSRYSPKILLIGTHGLYAESSDDPPESPHKSIDRLSRTPQAPDPMLRSGLAFAGLKNWRKGEEIPQKAGKGFLCARDVAVLDLWMNDVTVLCACQSAVGHSKTGEGVFGLRRAFAIAGSKSLVMSLWSVPEKASTLLIDRFFANLRQKMGRATALEEAQNYIRHITKDELCQLPLGREILQEIQETRESDRPLAHPFYWGAWVCQGDLGSIEDPLFQCKERVGLD